MVEQQHKTPNSWREKLRIIIFETETSAGKAFDMVLLLSIILSVTAVMLDSIATFNARHGGTLYLVEWFFTLLFTLEYALRLVSIGKPMLYARSFFGIVDLLAILPTYISMFIPGAQYLMAIRVLRVLRIFRVLKFVKHIREASVLMHALKESSRKITVFLFAVMTIVIIMGSLMYLVEGDESGFTSIPQSVYWAIVTLTTVGYGDISPQTPLGQAIAAVIMIMGYSIIAVPTGIVTVEMSRASSKSISMHVCPQCASGGHDYDAKFCKFCGSSLEV